MNNKRTRLPSFLAGMCLMALLTALAGTALAASGGVTFNTASLYLNGMAISEKGSSLKTDAGAAIPSTILYTDALGGKTHYVPVRSLTDALHLPLTWDGESSRMDIFAQGDPALYALPLSSNGKIMEFFQEIAPIPDATGKTVLSPRRHDANEGFSMDLPLKAKGGRYVSVTVENHYSTPLLFELGQRYDADTGDRAVFPTQIPAGETVTRTIQLGVPEDAGIDLYLFVGNPETVARPISATISAVQFDAKGENLERAIASVSLGNEDTAALLRKLSPQMVSGDYPKNAKGETYGPEILSALTGRSPDLTAALGTKGESGYIREADMPSVPLMPDTIMIPLYDAQGVVIGEFEMGGSVPAVEGKDLPTVKEEIAKAP